MEIPKSFQQLIQSGMRQFDSSRSSQNYSIITDTWKLRAERPVSTGLLAFGESLYVAKLYALSAESRENLCATF